MLRTFSVALKHTEALIGIAEHPLAISESVNENIKSVVRPSRNLGYLSITAIDRMFKVIFMMIIILMIGALTSSKLLKSMSRIQYT